MPFFRSATLALGLVSLTACAPKADSPLPTGWETELLKVREQVWRDWFAGAPALTDILPADFVGIGMGDGPWSNKETTISGSKEFAASGSKLESLTFPKTTTQQFGNVVVVYSNYELAFTSSTGEKTNQQGRATEIFVWRNGKWFHPGWHLDSGR